MPENRATPVTDPSENIRALVDEAPPLSVRQQELLRRIFAAARAAEQRATRGQAAA